VRYIDLYKYDLQVNHNKLTRYGLEGSGFELQVTARDFFFFIPVQPWRPPSLLYNGYQGSFPGVQHTGRGLDHPQHIALRLRKSRSVRLLSFGASYSTVMGALYLLTTPNNFILYSDQKPKRFSQRWLCRDAHSGIWRRVVWKQCPDSWGGASSGMSVNLYQPSRHVAKDNTIRCIPSFSSTFTTF
jgi:hypothetical protein